MTGAGETTFSSVAGSTTGSSSSGTGSVSTSSGEGDGETVGTIDNRPAKRDGSTDSTLCVSHVGWTGVNAVTSFVISFAFPGSISSCGKSSVLEWIVQSSALGNRRNPGSRSM